MSRLSILLVGIVLASVPARARADTFDDFSTAFSTRVSDGFGVTLVETDERRASFARREYFAHVANKALALAQLRLHASVQGDPLNLETMRGIIHTGGWDCSVNHACWSCDGKKWWQRGPCEIGRAACAAAQAPRLGVCSAGKALDGAEFGRIDFSGALLSLDADASDFNLQLDDSLSTLRLSPKVSASASVQNLKAAIHLNAIIGIFTGCPLPPTISVPPIGLSLSSSSIPVSGSIFLDDTAMNGLQVSFSLDSLSVKAQVNTGDIFGWIERNPLQVITCPLPTIAGFTYATTVSEHEFPLINRQVKTRLSSFTLKRAGQAIVVVPRTTPKAIGVIESSDGKRPAEGLPQQGPL